MTWVLHFCEIAVLVYLCTEHKTWCEIGFTQMQQIHDLQQSRDAQHARLTDHFDRISAHEARLQALSANSKTLSEDWQTKRFDEIMTRLGRLEHVPPVESKPQFVPVEMRPDGAMTLDELLRHLTYERERHPEYRDSHMYTIDTEQGYLPIRKVIYSGDLIVLTND